MTLPAHDQNLSMLRLLRRAALVLCFCFPIWALYLLFFQLRIPYGEPSRNGTMAMLQNVEQMLRENLQDQVRHAEFREGANAREERILKMRGVFEASVLDMKNGGETVQPWISSLDRAIELARKTGTERERESAELEMRVAGALVLGEIGRHVAQMQNPPYEAFESQRRQVIVILLVAFAIMMLPLVYLGYEEWREASPDAAPRSLTAAPWMEEAFQRFPEAVLAFDEELRVRWANSAAERLLEYRPRELEGVSAVSLFPANGGKGSKFTLADNGGKLCHTARRRGGDTFEATFQVVRAGSRTLLLVREQLAEARDRVQGAHPVDVQALREERDYFGDLLRAAPAPLIVLNHDGHIVRLNRAAEEMLEYSAAEVTGAPYWDLFLGEEGRPAAEICWGDLKLNKARQQVEEIWRPRTQPEIRLRWQRAVLLDPNGQVRNVVAAAEPVVAMAAAAAAGASYSPSLELMPRPGAAALDLRVSAPISLPQPGGSMDSLEDRLTEVIGYAELALMAMPGAVDSRRDVERVKSAATEAIELWAKASARERVDRR